MIKLCAVLLLFFIQRASGQWDRVWDYNYTTETTPTTYPFVTTPRNAKSKYCSSEQRISSSQVPYFDNDYNFFCQNYWQESRTPYMRIRTQFSSSVTNFRLRVTVKFFKTQTVASSNNYYQGFFIANSYSTRYYRPSYDNPNDMYSINCIYGNDCSFTAESSSDVDIIMYFDRYSINSYSFVIDDITPLYSKTWSTIVILLVLVVIIAIFWTFLRRYLRRRRIAESHRSARMDRIPDGPVVSFGSDERSRQERNLYQPPTISIPSFETNDEKIAIPDGPRIHPDVI